MSPYGRTDCKVLSKIAKVTMAQQYTVRAPGSSGNLGPGFDVLSVSLARYVWASNFGEAEPCDSYHIALKAYQAAGGKGQLWFRHELEPGRGLGFSAAARVAGAAIAFLEQGLEWVEVREQSFKVAAELEKHGDNSAASAFGGFNIIVDGDAYQLDVDSVRQILYWIASDGSSTDKSRSTLADAVHIQDAVYNMAHTSLLISALYEGNLDLLSTAVSDKLHQPIRLANLPDSQKALTQALEAGAKAAWLSGSGPSVAIVAGSGDVERIASLLPDSGKTALLDVDLDGLKLC